jgi:rare lipoprotein A
LFLLLKNIVIAAGAFLATSIVVCAPATASAHPATRNHRGHVRVEHVARQRPSLHGRRVAARFANPHRRMRWAHRAGSSRRFALAHRSFGHHGRRYAGFARDRAIRNYVGPASAYRQVSSPAGAQVGGASYYGGSSHTASGGHVGAATCAHRSLPFGTKVLVTNLANARQAVLTVNDRGPFVRGRIVDVSVAAAGVLGMIHSGTARVSLQVVGGAG